MPLNAVRGREHVAEHECTDGDEIRKGASHKKTDNEKPFEIFCNSFGDDPLVTTDAFQIGELYPKAVKQYCTNQLYDDATAELGSPVYQANIGFTRRDIFKDNVPDCEILEHWPWFTAFCPERKDTCRVIDILKGEELQKLLIKPFIVNGHIFNVKLCALQGDGARLWKTIANKCGGHHR